VELDPLKRFVGNKCELICTSRAWEGNAVLVVEPVVTEEKLRQLLDEGGESAQLDFKQQLDLSV
jgi:hypothetical protein